MVCTVPATVLATLVATASASGLRTQRVSWKPTACSEQTPGEPCRKLYEHPLGSTFVGECPVESMVNPAGCAAANAHKADGDKCPQISCPKALGVTFKLVCAGTCCPTCWAPDHVVALDRHTKLEDPEVVPPAPQAPGTCGGARCFQPVCARGFEKGYVQGSCCYSCIPGR
mmetsp:Transcript_19341/g.56148  ORF Transcript_19341/g.56148 Transcript_19341/m.56148 type:complete len:171 (-) Transcript_19341:55-567(-)